MNTPITQINAPIVEREDLRYLAFDKAGHTKLLPMVGLNHTVSLSIPVPKGQTIAIPLRRAIAFSLDFEVVEGSTVMSSIPSIISANTTYLLNITGLSDNAVVLVHLIPAIYSEYANITLPPSSNGGSGSNGSGGSGSNGNSGSGSSGSSGSSGNGGSNSNGSGGYNGTPLTATDTQGWILDSEYLVDADLQAGGGNITVTPQTDSGLSDIGCYMSFSVTPSAVNENINTPYNATLTIKNEGDSLVAAGRQLVVSLPTVMQYISGGNFVQNGNKLIAVLPKIAVNETITIGFALFGTLVADTNIVANITNTIHTAVASIKVYQSSVTLRNYPNFFFNIDVSDRDLVATENNIIKVAVALRNDSTTNWTGNEHIVVQLPEGTVWEGLKTSGISYDNITRKVSYPIQNLSVGQLVLIEFFLKITSWTDITLMAYLPETDLQKSIVVGVFGYRTSTDPIRTLDGVSILFDTHVISHTDTTMTYLGIQIATATPLNYEKLIIRHPPNLPGVKLGASITAPLGINELVDIIVPSKVPVDGYIRYLVVEMPTASFNLTQLSDWSVYFEGTNISAPLTL